MSIALVVTRGFGNGTLVGTIKDVVTMGYTIGAAVSVTPDHFFTTNKQTLLTTNIDSVAITTNKTVSFTTDLGD